MNTQFVIYRHVNKYVECMRMYYKINVILLYILVVFLSLIQILMSALYRMVDVSTPATTQLGPTSAHATKDLN